jgi:proline iminopeptidase
VSKLLPDEAFAASYGQDATTLAFARIECHYFVHKGWLESEDQLLRDAPGLSAIPGTIVQGRYDCVCPPQNAWDLHKAWPGSELVMVPDAGHSATEWNISKALVAATDRYAG